MSHELDEGALLAAARRGLSPTPDQAARVLQSTRAAITGGASTATPKPASTAAPAALAHAWLPNAIGALAIAAVSGAVGYQLGLRTSERRTHESDTVAALAPAPAAAPQPVTQPEAPATTNAEPAQAATPAAPAAVPARSTATRATTAASEPSARSMQEEIDALRRVDRVLHDHDPRRALALLYELDRNVPSGKLMQEREAAFAMARCALGLGSAEQLASDFAARYPGSVYQQRVRQTCTPDQRNRTEPETHE